MTGTSFINIRALKYFAVAVALGLILCAPGTTARAADEYAVKAAFVFNFIKFTQWPANDSETNAPLTLCFTGNNTGAFSALNGKKNGIRIIRATRLRTSAQCRDCDIIFIGRDTPAALALEILSKAKGKPILTIGETETFARRGGVINFFSRDDRLHFEINTRAADQKGLKLSSRLLKLAVIVE